ncbi:MAG: thioredoxin family protein [bacterium]
MKILKFGAVWCSGCLVMKPLWKKIEEEMIWLETEYYDYDQNKDMAEKYKIDDRLPAFIFLDKNGNELFRLHGEIDKEKLVKIIEENRDK